MKKIILVISIMCMVFPVFSQESDKPVKEFKNEFGINTGFTTGVGLSYRHWFGNTGFQLTALPIKTDDYAMVSTGFSLLYSFHSAKYFRFYGYLGNHYIYTKTKESYFFDGSEPEIYTEKKRYNIGIGPGFALGKIVRFNIQFGYGYYDILGEQNLIPTGEMGLYYNF